MRPGTGRALERKRGALSLFIQEIVIYRNILFTKIANKSVFGSLNGIAYYYQHVA